jgi:hypothetical protein
MSRAATTRYGKPAFAKMASGVAGHGVSTSCSFNDQVNVPSTLSNWCWLESCAGVSTAALHPTSDESTAWWALNFGKTDSATMTLVHKVGQRDFRR